MKLKSAFVIAVALLLAIAPSEAAPPNVILVMTDDQGYGDLRCHGNSMINTPSLDKLHGQSVRLTNFHVDPTCSPTRAALLTGRYSTRAGVWHTIMGRSILFHDEATLAQMLGQAGYQCGVFGKWHLGDNYPSRPQDRGFHEVLIHGGGGITQTPDFWDNSYFDDTLNHNGKWEKFSGYCTKVFFDHALEFINQNQKKPFFVYLPVNVPHGPLNVAEKYSKPYLAKGVPAGMANFYGMIEEFDENMGRLLARLTEWGLEENTIIIFMTDNGTASGVARPAVAGKGKAKKAADANATWKGFSAGMRAQKGSEYDGGHRVPFFIRWPAGKIGGGKDVSKLAAHFDVLPTLAELCGVKQPQGRELDGRSLAPLLRDHTDLWPERTLFVHTQREELPPKWKRSAAMTERWRLVNGGELYDITTDPGQATDVAARHPDVVNRLRAEYEKWWASLEPRLKEYGWIVLGSPKENPALLNCMDWHADQSNIPWNQPAIKNAPWANGYWMVQVDRPGTYEFILRQQPAVAKFPIEASKARVKVGEVEESVSIPKGAESVTLKLQLPAAKTRMETWLIDESSGKSRGAFFVDVRRLN